jgi:hypothetical protein
LAYFIPYDDLSSSTHFPANNVTSVFFMAEYTCHIFFVHSSIVEHLSFFHNLAVVKRAARNMVCRYLSYILVYTPLDICIRVGCPGRKEVLFLVF